MKRDGHGYVRIARVDDSGDQQVLQAEDHGRPIPDVVHAQPYGLAVGLPRKSLGILHAVGGIADNLVAWACSFARHRPRNLAEGDVTLYDGHGNRLDLTDSGVALNCNATVNGTVDADGYKAGGTAGYTGSISIPTPGGTAILTVKGGLITGGSGSAVFAPPV